MSIKIEVNSQEVINKSGMGGNGKPYSINEQIAYAHFGDVYPEKIKVRLDDGQRPYTTGVYELDPKSFYVGKFGSLDVNPKLIRIGDIPAGGVATQSRGATAK